MKSLRNVITGGTKLRYHFEIVPRSVEGIKSQHDVSVVCESGSKISYTEPVAVAADGTASFSSVMRMTATIYKDNHTLLPKEYTFKIQTVQQTSSRLSSEPRRKTVARAKVNLAEYCSHSSTPAASEVQLQLKPSGILKLTIRAIWLQHYPQDKQDGRGSETDSTADVSSYLSSVSGDELQSEPVDRRHSVNLDDLADYHHHPAASSRHPGGITPALTANHQTPAISSVRTQQQQQLSADTTSSSSSNSVQLAAPASNASHTINSQSARHKRSSSTPAALHTIAPILEHDREGLDPASSLDRTLSAEGPEALNSVTHQQHSFLGIVREDSTAAAAAALAAAAASEEEEEPSGMRTLSLPSWMWPFGAGAGRKATTDELMRQIDTSGSDAPKLQQMCRALLCERNDWRYKATQWERNASSLEQQVSQLQQTKDGLLQHLQSLEAQLLQLQHNSLLDDLVAAKLQLAQAQEHAITLEGELHKERDRTRRLAAQLTALESKYAMLYEQHAAAAAAAAGQQQQQQRPSSAEQGEGLSITSPTAVASGAAAGRRVSYTGGWGSMFMRAGSLVMGNAVSSNSTTHNHQHQQDLARRASEPGVALSGYGAAQQQSLQQSAS